MAAKAENEVKAEEDEEMIEEDEINFE